jgi:thermolysin
MHIARFIKASFEHQQPFNRTLDQEGGCMSWYKHLLATCMLLSASSIAWAAAGSSSGTPQVFLSLSGDEARHFVVPSDVQLDSREAPDQRGLTRERYQQYFGDAKVLGGQLTLYRDTTGASSLVIGSYYAVLTPSNRRTLAADEARQIVERELGPQGRWNIDLLIDPKTGQFFYRVDNQRFDSRMFYWIDAENGLVLKKYSGLTTGQGLGVKGDLKDLTGLTAFNGSVFELRAADGRQVTHDIGNRPRFSPSLFPQLNQIVSAFLLPGTVGTDPDDQWIDPGAASPGQPALVDAHYYARVTDLYYVLIHGHNSLDGAGLPMISTTHYARNYANAFWNGSQMVYGDGDGTTSRELSGGLDVVGHELTHGVTEFTSGLMIQDESGALNEAFSDIMGTNIEFFAATNRFDPAAAPDFLIGEDVFLSGGVPGLRNMADPAEKGDPDHYSERQIGGGDNGGVHTNSGIPNHAYYLLVNGGRNAGESRGHPHSGPVVAGIGLAAAEQIFYLAFTGLPENATMCNARLATQAVAAALLPSALTSVSNAWQAVGVPDNC